MGLLDSLSGPMLGQLAGVSDEGHENLVEAIGGILRDAGGLDAFVAHMEQLGLGELAASWVGNGPNLPISAQQVESVLGTKQVHAVAQKVGMSPEETSEHLAILLPQLVDRLTPGGFVPEWGALGGLLGTLE